MVKNIGHTPKLKKKYYPFVSVCTPTFNRRPFIPTMMECFKNYDYPKDRIEWIIVDDGTDPIEDIVTSSGISQIKYIRSEKRMNLGEKRNYMHTFCKGTIIVYMDDDDYYPPDRVTHAVDVLTTHPTALCAGSSEVFIYFKQLKKMIQCGPYGENHSTAGTFAFKSELLKQTRYDDNAALAEEKSFLKDYTIPFAQLDPMKTILVFSHEHNSFDKRKLLENSHPQYLKESMKKVEDFIKFDYEATIKNFFMNTIDNLLKGYECGEPKNKPEVLEQIKKIDEERKRLTEQANRQGPKLMMDIPGQGSREISTEEIMEIMNTYVAELKRVTQRNVELEELLKKPVSEDMNVAMGVFRERIQQLEKKNVLLNYKVNEANTPNVFEKKMKYLEGENIRLIKEVESLKNENKLLLDRCSADPSINSSIKSSESIIEKKEKVIFDTIKSKSTPEVMVQIL